MFLKLGDQPTASAVARASCNGGLGAVPLVGSRGKPLVGGQGASPLKLTTFLHLNVNLNNKNCIIFCIIYAINNATIYAD
jgi:hypothetical protein